MDMLETALRQKLFTEEDASLVHWSVLLRILRHIYGEPTEPPETCEEVLLRYCVPRSKVSERPHRGFYEEDEVNLSAGGPSTVSEEYAHQFQATITTRRSA